MLPVLARSRRISWKTNPVAVVAVAVVVVAVVAVDDIARCSVGLDWCVGHKKTLKRRTIIYTQIVN